MAIYGVCRALTDGVGKALIADPAPRELRGTLTIDQTGDFDAFTLSLFNSRFDDVDGVHS